MSSILSSHIHVSFLRAHRAVAHAYIMHVYIRNHVSFIDVHLVIRGIAHGELNVNRRQISSKWGSRSFGRPLPVAQVLMNHVRTNDDMSLAQAIINVHVGAFSKSEYLENLIALQSSRNESAHE